jgi:hypothetical protein
MSCFINPVEEGLCVYLTYAGDCSMIEIMSARYEANALLAAKRWNRIVVDITGLLSKFAAQELFEFARDLSEDLPESVRVALVARPDQAKHAKLIENVARNDGLFLSFFLDVEEATIWAKGINLHKRTKPQPAGNLVKVS